MAEPRRRVSIYSVLMAVVIVVGALAYFGLTSLEPMLMYHPDRVRTPPQAVGLAGVAEVELKTPDGNMVLAWWSRPKPGRPTVLYFHGNGASLANRAHRIQRFQQVGLGVFVMTYRGYGGSTGKPTERDNVADAKQAYDHLIAAGIKPHEIVLFGESLGTGIAVQVAAEKEIRGLILDSPYTSMLDLAATHYPILPADLVMKDRYETMRYIEKVRVPLLVVHGEADQVIPIEMGRKVLAAAQVPKEMIAVPGAPHVNHDPLSFDRILVWIGRLYGPASGMGGMTGPGGVSGMGGIGRL